jgi:MFS superfamily sulfate permease-like transporter
MFLNYISFTYAMDSIPRDSGLVVSLHNATFLDHTVMEYLHQIENEFLLASGTFAIEGHDRHHKYSLHPLAARRLKSDL